MLCPCGKTKKPGPCCEQYIAGTATPRTAEALMRSRYTAYTMAAVDYLLRTHRPPPGESLDRVGIENFARQCTWLGLKVLRTEDGGPEDDEGVVEFEARYRSDGKATVMRERSLFRKQDGIWYYITGAVSDD